MASRDPKTLHPLLQPLAQQFLVQCMAEGINVFLTCCYRSNEEQDEDYAKGRTFPGKIITNAQAGQSPHNCTIADGNIPAAKAFDFGIKTNEGSLDWDASDVQWVRARDIGESLGLYSGEYFPRKDYDHLELPNWRDVA